MAVYNIKVQRIIRSQPDIARQLADRVIYIYTSSTSFPYFFFFRSIPLIFFFFFYIMCFLAYSSFFSVFTNPRVAI